MAVRAKFRINTQLEQVGGIVIGASAVYGGSDENKAFAKATPAGTFSITIDQDTPAYEHMKGTFKPGKCIYLDLSIAEE